MRTISLIRKPAQSFSKKMTHTKHIIFLKSNIEKENCEYNTSGINYLLPVYMVYLFSAWQVFIEDVVKYGSSLKIQEQSLSEDDINKEKRNVDDSIRNFRNPTTQHINDIISKTLGIKKISEFWFYEKNTKDNCMQKLDEIFKIRNAIVHEGKINSKLTSKQCFDYMNLLVGLSFVIQTEIEKVFLNSNFDQ